MHLFRNGNVLYSVDGMIDFVNVSNLHIIEYKVADLQMCLKNKAWISPYLGEYSPIEVLNSPYSYWHEYNRIMDSDLRFPIIINNGIVVDGLHRLAKCYFNDQPYIYAYELSDEIMDLFIL